MSKNNHPGSAWPSRPLIAGHRGAPAFRPEHTLASYQRAIDDGADLIEPDLVITSDGVLIARHENEISGTTDISTKDEFAHRRTIKLIDGIAVEGWFAEDFTLAEIKTLRATERIPLNRPDNVAYNGLFEIPTLQEIINLAKQQSHAVGRVIGIYPETKHPSYFRSIGLPLEDLLVKHLHENGYIGAEAPALIQSFEVSNLKALRMLTAIRLVQLIGEMDQCPYDFLIHGDRRTYADLITPEGLRDIATYADIVAPHKNAVISRDQNNALTAPTRFVTDAHTAGLQVHVYTMRPENPFLPTPFRQDDIQSSSTRGDAEAEMIAYLNAGIDGFFTDDSAAGLRALNIVITGRI